MVKQLAFVFLFVVFDGIFGLRVSHAQPPRSPEEIWRSLEGLSPAQRERLLIEGAKTEDGIVWYTNSSQRNAARY
ncbi:MAG TPA: hypothetical protein VE131_03675, partial [Terriglobales bacterium]|nr:hypothetical protein [Terriglobales bacterium]